MNEIIDKRIYTDNFIKSSFDKRGLLFNSRYDEPTYLTVRVDFFPGRYEKFNNIDEYQSSENLYNNSSYDSMPHPLFESITSGTYSTLNYLKNNIGDEYRANLLEQLIKGLADLSYDCPYYISSVSGLNDILSVDPKRGSRLKNDAVITLKCIEGLDQRISAIKNLYKKIAWDDVYQRWILPDIMRYFKIDIYISEFRIFHKSNKNYNKSIDKKDIYEQLKYSVADYTQYDTYDVVHIGNLGELIYNSMINLNVPTMKLSCYMCEFDINDMYNHLSELTTDNRNNPINTEIKIKIGNIIEQTSYNFFGNTPEKNRILLNDEVLSDILKFKKSYDSSTVKIEDKDATDHYYVDKNRIKFNILANNSENNKKSNLVEGHHNMSLLAKADPLKDLTSGGGGGYINNFMKNSATQAVAYGKNFVKDKVTELMNTNLVGGNSLNDIIYALKSENLFEMFRVFKNNAASLDLLYPEVSAATKDKISLTTFKNVLKDLSTSIATDPKANTMKNIAQGLLQYGEATGATEIEDYMNVLRDAIDDVRVSHATQHASMPGKLVDDPGASVATKKIAL